MAKVTYTKPYRSVDQLIELLKVRGLVFDGDEDMARRFLSCVNYYRFTGYALPFLASRERFRPGARFSYLHAVYLFDRRLRNLCAHHCRMYDRRFSYRFPKPIAWRGIPDVDTATLFCQFALVYRLLKPTDVSAFDRDVWRRELCEFLRTMPSNPVCDHHARAGLPFAPEESPLW